MTRAIRAIVWEILWKNRCVFPALGLLWVIGMLMAHVHQAPPDAWWAGNPFLSALLAFFVSLLLVFAPFTLMEGHGSWRMNSMTTRWCLRPLPIWLLVLVPLLLACLVMAVFMTAWRPVFREIAPRFDQAYVLAVMLTAVAAMQTLAWATARRPGQFWFGVGLLFPVLFGAQLIRRMPDMDWLELRSVMLWILAMVTAALTTLTFWIARATRCGAWPGLFQWPWSAQFRTGEAAPARFSSPARALFWSDVLPGLRAFAVGWLLLACLLTGVNLLLLCLGHRYARPTPNLALFAAVDVLPRWGMLYLAGYGMFAACQFGTGFHTRLDTFKATRPLTVQTLAVSRLIGLAVTWGIVWVPLLLLWRRYDTGMPAQTPRLSAMLAYVMAVSANVSVGALPILLLGRVEGLAAMLLTSFPAWAAAWLMDSLLRPLEVSDRRWGLLILLLVLKFGLAASLLISGLRARRLSPRLAATLLIVWSAAVTALIGLMHTWQTNALWGALAIVLLVPLGRLCACPLAMASNRTR